jgi:hypothetical protein
MPLDRCVRDRGRLTMGSFETCMILHELNDLDLDILFPSRPTSHPFLLPLELHLYRPPYHNHHPPPSHYNHIDEITSRSTQNPSYKT